ncbi:MAG TPA: hypothetical protein VGO21_02920 [Candidatus Paceibacterota bacterium]|jgi:hypothetical protein|nr:hypothetical protein [Candidatus Paceibacterota bacterium]
MIENKSVKNKLYLALYLFFIGVAFAIFGYHSTVFILAFYSIPFVIIVLISALIDYLLKRDPPVKVLSTKHVLKYRYLMWFLLLIVSIFLLYDVLRPR